MGISKSKILRRLLFDWLPAVAWGGVILYIGSSKAIPLSGEADSLRLLLRKSIHVGEYAIFGFLLYRAVRARVRPFSLRHALLVLLLTLAHASFDEWRQTSIPMRSGKVSDVGIDFLGGGIGFAVAGVRYKYRMNKKAEQKTR